MPINPTTLKASIDTQITNETVDFAITPSEVGGRMKDCVDYTTDQVALKENLITATTSAQYYRGDKTFATLNKAAVNLANVDNTSDVNKPISTATQVALDLKEDLINPTTSAQYYRGDKTFATLNKAAVNLASVDNTSDANKPISIATQTALNSKQSTLVSGTNIKTINGNSVLGSGDLVVSGSSVTKVLKTTITSAQILTLFDTPITVLDSTDPLTIKLPINIWIQRKAGNAYTLAAASFLLVNDVGGNVTGNLNPNPLTGTDIGFFTSAYTITQNSAGTDRNALYKLKASTGNPTGGTGDIDVHVTYIEITL